MRIPYKGAGIALFYCENQETYILLGKRSDHPFHNRWSVPGGGINKNTDKSDFDIATREFEEETGISFASLNSDVVSNFKIKFPLFCWTSFACLTHSNNYLFKPNEFYELKWINVKDINNYRLRPFTKKEIKNFYINRH